MNILADEDYWPIERNISFGAGLGVVGCVNIPILNDENFEPEFEEFTVSLSSQMDCVIIQDSKNITVTIIDDESALPK